MAKPLTSPIHLATARQRLLDLIVEGLDYERACEEINTSTKSVQRYCAKDPDFRVQLEAAKEAGKAADGPTPALAFMLDTGEPKPAPPSLFTPETAREIDRVAIEVALDPDHPAFGKVFPLVFGFVHARDLARIKRELAKQDGAEVEAVLVIRVPSNGTMANG